MTKEDQSKTSTIAVWRTNNPVMIWQQGIWLTNSFIILTNNCNFITSTNFTIY